MNKATIMITGCAGFIGSHVTDQFLSAGYRVIGYDSFTYAGKESNLSNAKTFGDRFTLIKGCITDKNLLLETIKQYEIKWIVNLAAETHVDNSILSCDIFLKTNITGIKTILDVCRETECLLFHFSTDEVYGVSPIGLPFSEIDALNPRNPYSATKAAADHMVLAYNNTFGTKFIMVRPSNNFGTRQHSEKFIPTIMRSLVGGKKIPIYGRGDQIREWTNVEETAKATLFIFEKSPLNEIYNITSGMYMKNIDVVKQICKICDLKFEDNVEYVQDRPGHDFRYAVSSSKLQKLGYFVSSDFESQVRKVIEYDFGCLRNKT